MMKRILTALLLLLPAVAAVAQHDDFEVTQSDGDVVVTYNTRRRLESVELFTSFDGGRTYEGPLSITGDTYDVYKGRRKSIVWDVRRDYPQGINGNLRFKLVRNYRSRFVRYGFLIPEFTYLGYQSGVGLNGGGYFGRVGLSLGVGGLFGADVCGYGRVERRLYLYGKVHLKCSLAFGLHAGLGTNKYMEIYSSGWDYGAWDPMILFGADYRRKHLVVSASLNLNFYDSVQPGCFIGAGYAF